jgi:hypothetical protein
MGDGELRNKHSIHKRVLKFGAAGAFGAGHDIDTRLNEVPDE